MCKDNNPPEDPKVAQDWLTYTDVLSRVQAENKPQTAMLPVMLSDVNAFARLALKACITINSGSLIAVPALVKIFFPQQIDRHVVGLLICSMLCFGAGMSLAVASAIAAFFVSRKNGKELADIVFLPNLEVRMHFLPRQMTADLIDYMTRVRNLQPKFQVNADRRVQWVALICILGFVAFLGGAAATGWLMVQAGRDDVSNSNFIAHPPSPLAPPRTAFHPPAAAATPLLRPSQP